jgi:hypothetical protein
LHTSIWFYGLVYEKLYRKRRWTWPQFVFVGCVVAILASALVPTFNSVAPKANQAAAAGNCRQIIIGLRLYAADHDGKYPDAPGGGRQTSNQVFRFLFREGYLEDGRAEGIFGAKVSPFVPDNVIGVAPNFPKALEAGENHWAMTKGVKDTSNPLTPLVFENPAHAVWPPMWNADSAGKKERGRTWRGGRIVVGFNDSSVQVIKLESTKGTSVGPAKDTDGEDIFTHAAESMEIFDVER